MNHRIRSLGVLMPCILISSFCLLLLLLPITTVEAHAKLSPNIDFKNARTKTSTSTATATATATSSSALQPWKLATDPNPIISIQELEEKATLKEIDDALDQVIGTDGGIIIQRFRPQPAWLWKQWFGTVLYETSSMAVKNMAWALIFCIVTRFATHGDVAILQLPSFTYAQSHPLLQSLQVVDKIWKTFMSLTTFLLTFFVGQAYAFWRGVHDKGRGIQGRLNDISMLMATNAARKNNGCYTRESLAVLECVAQKLRIFHLLFWASNAKRFRVLLTQQGLERMVEVGYLPREEKDRLDQLDLPPTQKAVGMMESALMVCQDAMRNKRTTKYPIGSMSATNALEHVVLEQFCTLRGTCATIPDLVDARMPLAYAHFVQILVDSFLVLAPVAQYTDLGIFCVISVGILTIFYQGLLNLAKVFLDPLDNEDYCEGCVYLDLAVLIREVNSASTRWFKGAAQA